MKKLLLHIGYPKTATTTLQEDVFLKLHELGKINYVGRTINSTHTRFGNSKFKGYDWVWHIRRHLILGEQMRFTNELLKDGVINVMSDEDLSFHDFFHYSQFGRPINHSDFPGRLKDILGNGVEIRLMVTIRNQPDLIFSCYIQKLRFIMQYLGNYSFNDFLNNRHEYLNRSQADHLMLFNFDYWIQLWEQTFEVESNVFLYEDLINDKISFFHKLAELLNLEANDLIGTMGEEYRRKRDKTRSVLNISYKTLNPFGKLLSKLYPGRSFERSLERRFYMRSNLFLNFQKRLFFRYKNAKVPKISSERRTELQKYFKESNMALARKKRISIDKLYAYGYISQEKY